MQRSAILGLLLACAASLGICAVIVEDGAPILWAQTASQLTDLPSQNGVVTPNPWNYLHRLSMLRLLIAATDPYMSSMGTNATDSPVWGLPLQLAWMLTSGESWGKKITQRKRAFNDSSMLRWFEFCDGNKCNMWILQDVSSTQLEPQPAASRQQILCVYPLRAGGAVSTTKAERHFKKTHKKKHCIQNYCLFLLPNSLQVLTTSQVLCLSCLLPKRVSWEQMFRCF